MTRVQFDGHHRGALCPRCYDVWLDTEITDDAELEPARNVTHSIVGATVAQAHVEAYGLDVLFFLDTAGQRSLFRIG
jgi:hypothetical protein